MDLRPARPDPAPPRLFLSLFAVTPEAAAGRALQPVTDRLLADLRRAGWPVFDSAGWPARAEAFVEIAAADAVVALIDGYWTSSTAKAIELGYACGEERDATGARLSPPRPVFACITDPVPWLRGLGERGRLTAFDGSFDDLAARLRAAGIPAARP